MRAKVFILLFILVLGVNCYSQVKPFRFGVTVAPNLAWISPDTKEYKNDGNQMGFSWGFIADVTLTENYFFKTGINMDYLNVQLEYSDSIMTLTDSVSGIMHRKHKLQYLEVPLTIKMRTNQFGKIAYYGEIGLGTAFNLKAKSKDEFFPKDDQNSINFEEDIKDDITFMKESLIFGAGLEYFIDNSTSIIIEVTFHNGLSNILKGENKISLETQRAHLHYFQLNVGIMF